MLSWVLWGSVKMVSELEQKIVLKVCLKEYHRIFLVCTETLIYLTSVRVEGGNDRVFYKGQNWSKG